MYKPSSRVGGAFLAVAAATLAFHAVAAPDDKPGGTAAQPRGVVATEIKPGAKVDWRTGPLAATRFPLMFLDNTYSANIAPGMPRTFFDNAAGLKTISYVTISGYSNEAPTLQSFNLLDPFANIDSYMLGVYSDVASYAVTIVSPSAVPNTGVLLIGSSRTLAKWAMDNNGGMYWSPGHNPTSGVAPQVDANFDVGLVRTSDGVLNVVGPSESSADFNVTGECYGAPVVFAFGSASIELVQTAGSDLETTGGFVPGPGEGVVMPAAGSVVFGSCRTTVSAARGSGALSMRILIDDEEDVDRAFDSVETLTDGPVSMHGRTARDKPQYRFPAGARIRVQVRALDDATAKLTNTQAMIGVVFDKP
ncbi:MAG: hypothetical protein AMXMBFR47_14000 [Planctomycetota bacterium]